MDNLPIWLKLLMAARVIKKIDQHLAQHDI